MGFFSAGCIALFWMACQFVILEMMGYSAAAFAPKIAVPFVRQHPPPPVRLEPILVVQQQTKTATIELPDTKPLPGHTFAGAIERGLKERFGSDVDRVIESLRLRELDYEVDAFVGSGNPETSKCRQICSSYVPGLTVREFWDTKDMLWVDRLKSKYKVIRDEFLQVTSDMDRLRKVGNNIWAGALTEDASSYGEGTFLLAVLSGFI